jgi:hypothetical protein
MTDEDKTSYIAILESEIETLKNKLNVPSIWEPRFKVYPDNENRFDFMVATIRLAIVTRYPHENKWRIHIDHQYGVIDVSGEKTIDEVKQFIIDTVARKQC